jgi:hypothetical protein
VLAYLSPDLESAEREATVFGRFVLIRGLARLRKALAEQRPSLSLVYVACHGSFGLDTTDFALAEAKDRLPLSTLDNDGELRLFGSTDAVVFLNACHSGRPLNDPLINDRYLRGFVELFLRKGARGVLGATGEVNTFYAAEVAARLLERATSEGGLPSVSVLLRDLRAEVVASLPATPDDGEEYRRLIWSSMYVFYGHPMTRLHVVQR